MARKRCETDACCSTARSLDQIGDGWSLLIVRSLFDGAKSFTALAENLGVARNILTDRLARMASHGVIEKAAPRTGKERWVYRLTDKGRDLLPVMLALMQWGDRWVSGGGNEPVIVTDARDGKPIRKLVPQSWDGRDLALTDLRAASGPGAGKSRAASVTA